MAVFQSYSSFFLLHGSYFTLAMLVILWLLESNRQFKQVVTMAVFAVAPYFLISFAILLAHMVFSVSTRYLPLVAGTEIKLAFAFAVLWRYFKMPPMLAGIYTIILVVAAQFSPVFVRALLETFEGSPGAMISLLLTAAVMIALLFATRRIETTKNRRLARCILIAAFIAPTLMIGHGGFAVLPAVMVWPFVFAGGVDTATMVISLAVSLCISTFLLLVAYRAIAKAQTDSQSGASNMGDNESSE